MLKMFRVLCICVLGSACSQMHNPSLSRTDIDVLVESSRKEYVLELSREIAVFDNVGFGLGLPLREYLNNQQVVKGKTILDLGTGAGVFALIALKNGASKAVATEINQYAIANAVYNAEQLGFKEKMDVRLVSMNKPGAYSVIAESEKFDLIVSNPPQDKDHPETIYDYSYADPNLSFLRSILKGLKQHLTPGGKGVFALYAQSLGLTHYLAEQYGLDVNVYLETENRNGLYYLVEVTSRDA